MLDKAALRRVSGPEGPRAPGSLGLQQLACLAYSVVALAEDTVVISHTHPMPGQPPT
jgi:hypothetical protein